MNTLKTLTSAAVLVSALAGAATANTAIINGVVHTDDNTVRWSGTTPVFASRCEFASTDLEMDMTFDEPNNTWTVDSTSGSGITVTMRDVSDVSLTPVDNILYKDNGPGVAGTDVGAVTVDYAGTKITWDFVATITSTGATSTDTGTGTDSGGSSFGITAGSGKTMTGTISFDEINGTVSHTRAITDSLESRTDYYVDHMITCTQ